MTDTPKLQIVSEQPKAEGNPNSVFDDLAALRKASKLTVVRKAVLVNVTVDKPANNVYFRCHRELVLDDATVLRENEGTSRTFYFVVPAHAGASATGTAAAARHPRADITWPSGNSSDLAGPDPGRRDFKAWKSARAAYELARDRWVRWCGTSRQRLPHRGRRGHRPRAGLAGERPSRSC